MACMFRVHTFYVCVFMPSACKQSCNCTHVYDFHKAITRIYRADDCGAASWAADKTKDNATLD